MRVSPHTAQADIEGAISSYDLPKDGKLSMTAAMAFAEKPRRLNDGAYVAIGEFDSKRILRRETYVEVPGIQIVDETIRILEAIVYDEEDDEDIDSEDSERSRIIQEVVK